MKKLFLSTCLIFALVALHAQQIEGTYKAGSDSLALSHEKAVFNLGGFGGLSINKIGEGAIEWIDDFLLIRTTDYSGEKTTVEPLNGSRKDTVVVKITDSERFAVQGVLVEWLNASGKTVEANASNDNGYVFHRKNNNIRKVKISMMGYDAIIFDYNTQKDYVIRLAKGDVIEHQTVAFRIKQPTDETIALLLLTTDFDNTAKDKKKELLKLERRAEKQNLLEKRLKKVYIPVYTR